VPKINGSKGENVLLPGILQTQNFLQNITDFVRSNTTV